MSSLATSLLLLAAVAVVAVFAYNVWLGRGRDAPRPDERRAQGSPAPEAAGPSGARAEPSLQLDPGRATDSVGARADAEPAPPQVEAPVPAAAPARAGPGPAISARTDCIVEWVLPIPLPGERLIHHTLGLRRAGSKPITVEVAALHDDAPGDAADAIAAEPASAASAADEPSLAVQDGAPPAPGAAGEGSPGAPAPAAVRGAPEPAWQAPLAGRQYDLVRVGILLANRHGPLNAMEFSEFVAGVHALAEQLSVLADTPDMSAVLARARELDESCEQLDAQVGLGVEAPEALGVADLARLAQACGCVERGNNRYARLGESGEVLFSLALADAPNRLTLLLDVPRAPAAQQPWRAMLECAQRCAQALGGVLTDDGGRPVAPEHLARIDQQIDQRYGSLEAAGFPAGSALALRLFN